MTDKTHGPIQTETREVMNALAKSIDDVLQEFTGKRWGFVLLVFPFGDETERRSNYISNANRADMVSHLKEVVARFEGRVTEEPVRKQ